MTNMNDDTAPAAHLDTEILAVDSEGVGYAVTDHLAREETLEIRVAGAEPVITMRTPGHDLELTAGLLLSEGLLSRRTDIIRLQHWMQHPDIVQVMVRSLAARVGERMARSSLSTSACGVCGKKRLNLEPLRALPALPSGPLIDQQTLLALPGRLRKAQQAFDSTGGLHAAGLFDARGRLCAAREDVGRHNALDKLLGWALLNDRLPLDDHVLVLSGRASFELMQKALMARVTVVCAISAPSSYTVDLAREFGATLAGFVRGGRFNIYTAPERIRGLRCPLSLQRLKGGEHESRRVS